MDVGVRPCSGTAALYSDWETVRSVQEWGRPPKTQRIIGVGTPLDMLRSTTENITFQAPSDAGGNNFLESDFQPNSTGPTWSVTTCLFQFN